MNFGIIMMQTLTLVAALVSAHVHELQLAADAISVRLDLLLTFSLESFNSKK